MAQPIGYPCTLKRDFSDLFHHMNVLYNNVGENNGGGTYSVSTHDNEKYVIEKMCELLHVDPDNVYGFVTNSGTDGLLHGLYTARKRFPNGIVYMSRESHFSVGRCVDVLQMEHKVIRCGFYGSMDITDFTNNIDTTRPAIVITNLGTTMKGAIDDTSKIVEILKSFSMEYYIHADAALMGPVIKSLDRYFDDIKYYDSMSMSGHKFFGVTFPCGIYMCFESHKELLKHYCEYVDKNILGISCSRNGHSAIFLKRILDTIDIDAEVLTNISNTGYLVKKLCSEVPGCNPWVNDRSFTVVFDSPSQEIINKWCLASAGGLSHVIVLKHVTKEVIDMFVMDMKRHYNNVKRCIGFKEKIVSTFKTISPGFGLSLIYFGLVLKFATERPFLK